MKTASLALATALALSSPVLAATMDYDIDAKSVMFEGGQFTLSLAAGDTFTISVDPADTWILGASPREFFVTGVEKTVGTAYGNYSYGGQSFGYGSLVGRIGTSGDFFFVGTNYTGSAAVSGNLYLAMWDSNFGDNSGSVRASITTGDLTAVPLPASAGLLLAGLGALALARRRR